LSAIPTEANFLRIVRIRRIVMESPLVKTFYFDDELCARGRPGQFVMIWLPSFDEIPMSLSSASNGLASITVAKVGDATELLHQKRRDEVIGVRGPLGNSFQPISGKALLVGGGTGIAPLAFLAENLLELGTKVTFMLGAKSKEELLFLTRLNSLLSKEGSETIVSTEDGSYGHKGVVTELAESALKRDKFDMIYTCGKEPMLLKIFLLAEKHKTPLQASLERLMRCAIGLCGSCTVGKYRVCIDGPVFTEKQLREVKDEFGHCKRNFDGREITL
jgi:dihydroorotate dehydrogenase electron transfer subunit